MLKRISKILKPILKYTESPGDFFFPFGFERVDFYLKEAELDSFFYVLFKGWEGFKLQ